MYGVVCHQALSVSPAPSTPGAGDPIASPPHTARAARRHTMLNCLASFSRRARLAAPAGFFMYSRVLHVTSHTQTSHAGATPHACTQVHARLRHKKHQYDTGSRMARPTTYRHTPRDVTAALLRSRDVAHMSHCSRTRQWHRKKKKQQNTSTQHQHSHAPHQHPGTAPSPHCCANTVTYRFA